MRQYPLIIMVEDLQWIDQTSEEFLTSLVESLPGASILLLCTYRPGYQAPWLRKSYATQIALQRLTLSDSLRIVQSILLREEIPEQIVEEILSKVS